MPDLSAFRCLAADDNAINRETLEALMAPTGLQLTLAEDGDQAIKLFAAAPARFDLLLLDISMPRLGGVEALAGIRQVAVQANLAPVPAIALTANALEEDKLAFLAAGFCDILIKPFRRRELAQLILQTVPMGRGRG
jgi:CheY-like chemotaxis protein